jgi:hypothetical protein
MDSAEFAADGLWVHLDGITYAVSDRPPALPRSVGIPGKYAEVRYAFKNTVRAIEALYIKTPAVGATQVVFFIVLEKGSINTCRRLCIASNISFRPLYSLLWSSILNFR